MAAANASAVYDLPPLPAYTLSPREPLLPPISDNLLSLMLPIVAYWAMSLMYHLIDVLDWFPHYRLHTPAEFLTRNRVTAWEVARDVVLQQIVQTFAGIAVSYFDPEEVVGKDEYNVAAWAQRLRLLQKATPFVLGLFGVDALSLGKNMSRNGYGALGGALAGGYHPTATQKLILESGVEAVVPAFTSWELSAASFIYYYFVPFLQFFWAFCVVDTWQFFLHRAMHLNRWLYVKFHSRHHRLYVPYAHGALYNHPVEGFLLDTAGTGVAFLTAGMSTRQSMWFFTLSTIKTVDDHCGYAFPWDPLQLLFPNNSVYHDVHHQSWGIKSNFSQPFFTFWDGLFGTRWEGDTRPRYERAREAAQRQVDSNPDLAAQPDADAPPAATVSPEAPETKARTRLRKKTASLSSPNVDGRKHGVTSSVL